MLYLVVKLVLKILLRNALAGCKTGIENFVAQCSCFVKLVLRSHVVQIIQNCAGEVLWLVERFCGWWEEDFDYRPRV